MAKDNEDKEFKYSVDDLASLMEVQPATVRVWLRNNGITRTGRSYGWNTKAELDALLKQRDDLAGSPAPAKAKKATPAKAKSATPVKAKKATPAKAKTEAPAAP